MRKPLVYVAGPMKSDPLLAPRQAAGVFRELREAGAVPFLPQMLVLHHMLDPHHYEEWMEYDFDVIRHADAVIRLEGDSEGADREIKFARELRLPVFLWKYEMEHKLFLQWISKHMEEGDDA